MSSQQSKQEKYSNTSSSQVSSSTIPSENTIPALDDALDPGYNLIDPHTQTLAYLFGLLPAQESQQFEHLSLEQSDYRNELEDVRCMQAQFKEWQDVPAPTDLAEKTWAFIQKAQKELNHT